MVDILLLQTHWQTVTLSTYTGHNDMKDKMNELKEAGRQWNLACTHVLMGLTVMDVWIEQDVVDWVLSVDW